MKKFLITFLIIAAISVAALGGTAFAYTVTSDFDEERLPEKTTINGIDCSGMTYRQAETLLSERWNSRHITVTGKLKDELADFTDFGYKYDIAASLNKIKKRNLLSASFNHYLGTSFDVNIPMKVSDFDPEFKDRVKNSECFIIKNAIPGRDAYVDMEDPDFKIVKEVVGTEPDIDKVFNDITSHIERGKPVFVFDNEKYLSLPEVTSDDPKLLEYQKFCRKYLKQKITYQLGEDTFTISPEQLAGLMLDDMSGNADEKAVRSYVSKLADEYDNIGAERKFRSYSGKDITVSGGIYGWEIDQESEAAHLTADINSHKNVSRKPEFSASGFGEYAKIMGDTYIDADISQQKVRYYKNGELVFSSDFVSGNRATGTLTDIGTFYVINKVRNVVLRGDNVDGTEYASPVKYWLGINWSGEGFHDSDWRSTYGGSIWKYNGSHGCLNIPPRNMPSFYNMAEIGTPVIVHY
ncbi:MAG: L,D-transpeptidase family protein [Anaerovoracaceae bacterium]|nr:L,D-transpeptidase family protein [Anaerovoracaceae bacterium]